MRFPQATSYRGFEATADLRYMFKVTLAVEASATPQKLY
jgi:hypothetical protein